MVKTVHPVTFEREHPGLKDFRGMHPSMQGPRPKLVLVDEAAGHQGELFPEEEEEPEPEVPPVDPPANVPGGMAGPAKP